MTMREAEEFIASVPWRHVKMVPVGQGLTEEEAISGGASTATSRRTRTST